MSQQHSSKNPALGSNLSFVQELEIELELCKKGAFHHIFSISGGLAEVFACLGCWPM